MTVESISDQLARQNRQAEAFRKVAKNKGVLGFSGDDGINEEVVKIAEITGRCRKVNTSEGVREITARATVVRTSGGYITIIPGGESRIISMQIDKAGKILPERYVNEIKSALGRDRQIRKANIGAG